MGKTRADTLGIHLILRSRDRREQVVLRDADASKTVVILETGANYSSSAPAAHPAGVSTTVHDSTTFRLQLRLALFTLRPRAPTPRRPRFPSFHPVPRLSSSLPHPSLPHPPAVSLLKLLPRMTDHGIAFPFHAVDPE